MKKNGQILKNAVAFLIFSLLCSFTAPSLFAQEKAKQDKVYEQVAVKPKFQEGDIDAFRNWVMKNVSYPKESIKNAETGKVKVEFIVEKDGSIKEAKVKEGATELLNKEAIRAVKSSPKWTPGKDKSGKTVRVRFVITVKFALS